MSIATDLKGYADAAVETGRSAINDGISQGRTAVNEGLTQLRTAVDEGIDGAGDRATKLSVSASGIGTYALNRARYNAYAAVGAGDLAVSTLITRAQELPGDVSDAVAKAQAAAVELADKLQARVLAAAGKAGDVVGTAQGTVDGVRSGRVVDQVRENAESYGKQLNRRRAELFNRGEHVVAELRKDPRVAHVAGLVETATDTVTEAVTEAAAYPARRRAGEKAAATRARNARTAKAAATRARKSAPAKKAAPRKSAARSTTTGSTGTSSTTS